MSRSSTLLLVGLAVVGSAGCNRECDSMAVDPQYRVTVRDADTKASICDATVSIGNQYAKPVACRYVLSIPTMGTATLHVERDGYAPKDQPLSKHSDYDACDHAIPVDVDVSITKTL